MFELVRGTHVLAAVAATALVLLFFGASIPAIIWPWLGSMWLLQLAQESLARARYSGASARWRVRSYAALNIVSFGLWGVSIFFISNHGHWEDVALGLYLFVVAYFPVSRQSALPFVYAASVALCMTPFIVMNMPHGSHILEDNVLAMMIIFGSGYAIRASFVMHRERRLALETATERDTTAQSLAEHRSELDTLSERLQLTRDRDALTGVASPQFFADAVAGACRRETRAAVLAVKALEFTAVNDAFGREAGNHLLSTVASRLVEIAGNREWVTRMAGTEFLMLIEADRAPERVRSLLDDLKRPIWWADQKISLTFAAGLARYPDDVDDAETLVEAALMAMRYNRTPSDVQMFDHSRAREVQGESRLRWELVRALDRGEFVLHYQPKIELSTGAFAGAEALLRWQHPRLGLLAPDRFIGMAEESGVIQPLGVWVQRTALDMAREICRTARKCHIAVNVSPYEFAHGKLVENISRALEAADLAPAHLQIELTESALIHDPAHVHDQLTRLRALGVGVALDDFGTGYSSLSYLRGLPLDTIKLDRAFMRDVPGNVRSSAIVKSVLNLSGELGLDVVCEGIEDSEQRDWLVRHGCRYGQGYLIAKPMPAEALRDWTV